MGDYQYVALLIGLGVMLFHLWLLINEDDHTR